MNGFDRAWAQWAESRLLAIFDFVNAAAAFKIGEGFGATVVQLLRRNWGRYQY